MAILTLKYAKRDSLGRDLFYVWTSEFYVNDHCLVNNTHQDIKAKASHVKCPIPSVGNTHLPFGGYMNHDRATF